MPRFFHSESEEQIIPPARLEDEPGEIGASADPLEKFLRETKSGTAEDAPEKIRGGGASGTTDEAGDISLE